MIKKDNFEFITSDRTKLLFTTVVRIEQLCTLKKKAKRTYTTEFNV